MKVRGPPLFFLLSNPLLHKILKKLSKKLYNFLLSKKNFQLSTIFLRPVTKGAFKHVQKIVQNLVQTFLVFLNFLDKFGHVFGQLLNMLECALKNCKFLKVFLESKKLELKLYFVPLKYVEKKCSKSEFCLIFIFSTHL